MKHDLLFNIRRVVIYIFKLKMGEIILDYQFELAAEETIIFNITTIDNISYFM